MRNHHLASLWRKDLQFLIVADGRDQPAVRAERERDDGVEGVVVGNEHGLGRRHAWQPVLEEEDSNGLWTVLATGEEDHVTPDVACCNARHLSARNVGTEQVARLTIRIVDSDVAISKPQVDALAFDDHRIARIRRRHDLCSLLTGSLRCAPDLQVILAPAKGEDNASTAHTHAIDNTQMRPPAYQGSLPRPLSSRPLLRSCCGAPRLGVTLRCPCAKLPELRGACHVTSDQQPAS
mmetsp:Transcript_7872/g.16017  ORF Transcript_7872/g.16017 Transcript_7872/m.16017 type:complete len:236 (-) Transcript_7872:249-956(-)